MNQTRATTLPALEGAPLAVAPLFPLEAENRALGEAADNLARLLKIPAWSSDDVAAADELVRALRVLLPAHFLKMEHILFPALAAAGVLPPAEIARMRQQHLTIEDDFAGLQALVLAIGISEPNRGLRRRVLHALRSFKAGLDDLLAVERSVALEPAGHLLPRTALDSIHTMLDAAELRDVLKRLSLG